MARTMLEKGVKNTNHNKSKMMIIMMNEIRLGLTETDQTEFFTSY